MVWRMQSYLNAPRRFVMLRSQDVSGVSGTGPVAFGVMFHDGTVVTRWISVELGQSTCVWPSLTDVLAIHGHHGLTTVAFLDD